MMCTTPLLASTSAVVTLECSHQGGQVLRGCGELHNVLGDRCRWRLVQCSWDQDVVNDVYDTVASINIGSCHPSVVNKHVATVILDDEQLFAFQRLHPLSKLQVSFMHSSTSNDVVLKQVLELLDVLWVKQVLKN